MTTFATDTALTGGRGTPNAWSPGSDSHNWTQSRGNQSLSFASNQLVLTYNGSTTSGVMTYAALTETDTEVLVNAVQTATNDIIGAAIRFVDTNNYYQLVLGNTANTLEIRKNVASTFSTIGSAAFTDTAGTKYSFRFQAIGTSLRAKIWQAGTSEPGTWTIGPITDSSLASGLFGIVGAPHTTGNTTKYDTFSATNGAVAAVHFALSDGYGGVFS